MSEKKGKVMKERLEQPPVEIRPECRTLLLSASGILCLAFVIAGACKVCGDATGSAGLFAVGVFFGSLFFLACLNRIPVPIAAVGILLHRF
jgi:hypothetical protein